MRPYTCHKRVQAAQIIQILHPRASGGCLSGGCLLHLDDGQTVVWDSVRCITYQPVAGDYVVLYEPHEPGKAPYISVSPRKAFEDGYALSSGQFDMHGEAKRMADWISQRAVPLTADELRYHLITAMAASRANSLTRLAQQHTIPAGLDLENPGDKAAITEICNERAALERDS